MYRPQRPENLRLLDQYSALLGAQARIAKTVIHTEALIADASAAVERTRSALNAHRTDSPPMARTAMATRGTSSSRQTARSAARLAPATKGDREPVVNESSRTAHSASHCARDAG